MSFRLFISCPSDLYRSRDFRNDDDSVRCHSRDIIILGDCLLIYDDYTLYFRNWLYRGKLFNCSIELCDFRWRSFLLLSSAPYRPHNIIFCFFLLSTSHLASSRNIIFSYNFKIVSKYCKKVSFQQFILCFVSIVCWD